MSSCGSSRVDRLAKDNHSNRSSISENVHTFKMTSVGALGLSGSVYENKKLCPTFRKGKNQENRRL